MQEGVPYAYSDVPVNLESYFVRRDRNLHLRYLMDKASRFDIGLMPIALLVPPMVITGIAHFLKPEYLTVNLSIIGAITLLALCTQLTTYFIKRHYLKRIHALNMLHYDWQEQMKQYQRAHAQDHDHWCEHHTNAFIEQSESNAALDDIAERCYRLVQKEISLNKIFIRRELGCFIIQHFSDLKPNRLNYVQRHYTAQLFADVWLGYLKPEGDHAHLTILTRAQQYHLKKLLLTCFETPKNTLPSSLSSKIPARKPTDCFKHLLYLTIYHLIHHGVHLHSDLQVNELRTILQHAVSQGRKRKTQPYNHWDRSTKEAVAACVADRIYLTGKQAILEGKPSLLGFNRNYGLYQEAFLDKDRYGFIYYGYQDKDTVALMASTIRKEVSARLQELYQS